jgi:hypothetical protein
MQTQKTKKDILFIDWLIQQIGRDDLIGDVAIDVKREIDMGIIKPKLSYSQIFKHIKRVQRGRYFVQHNDKDDPETKRKKIEKKMSKELNRPFKLNDSYVNSHSPLYCLQLAYNEYCKATGYVYFIGIKDNNKLIKIGFSSNRKNFLLRQKTIQTYSPFDTFLIGYITTYNWTKIEKELHNRFNKFRKKGEWFELPIIEVENVLKEYNGYYLN